MRAYALQRFGGPEVFEAIELPEPVPAAGEVLVRVAASSVNPVDTKIRKGVAAALAPPFPARLHGDVAGVVEALGPGTGGFAPGDEVYGCVGGVGSTQGVLADLVVADARLLARKPRNLSFAEAAALPLVALTAWEGWDKARLGPGARVLVHGGTGGVGHVALQLAKVRGAWVAATAGTAEKRELARSLGADAVIDYRAEPVAGYVERLTDGRGFDVVFDTVGGANVSTSVQAAKLNGAVVCIQGRGALDGGELHARATSLHLVFMLIPLLHGLERERHGRILTELAALVEAGRVRPLLDGPPVPFAEVGAAHTRAESGEATGKVVLVR